MRSRWGDPNPECRSKSGVSFLTLIDSFTRESLAIKVAQSLLAQAVTDALEEVIATRGQPQTIERYHDRGQVTLRKE